MNSLLDIQEKIRANAAAIGLLEVELVRKPDSLALHANLRSLRKLHDSLSDEFNELRKTRPPAA